LLKAFWVNLKICLGLVLPNQYCHIVKREYWGWFCGIFCCRSCSHLHGPYYTVLWYCMILLYHAYIYQGKYVFKVSNFNSHVRTLCYNCIFFFHGLWKLVCINLRTVLNYVLYTVADSKGSMEPFFLAVSWRAIGKFLLNLVKHFSKSKKKNTYYMSKPSFLIECIYCIITLNCQAASSYEKCSKDCIATVNISGVFLNAKMVKFNTEKLMGS